MKNLLYPLFIASAFFLTNLLYSQGNNHLSKQNSDSEKTLKEIVSERTLNAKHFQGANGSVTAEISTGSIHYKDKNGKWEDINTEIVPSNNPNYKFENSTNNLKSYYSNNGVLIETDAGNIKIGVNPSLVSINKNNEEKTIEKQSSSEGNLDGNTLIYRNAFQFGDIEYIVENDKVKNNLILKSLPAQLSNEEEFLGFSESIMLPEGWKIVYNGNTVEKSAKIDGQLIIQNRKGENVMIIPTPEVFDASLAPISVLNSEKKIVYKVTKIEDGYQLITMVSLEWLKSPKRIYPIRIDPTVTLPGTLGGWQGNVNGAIDNGNFVFAGLLSSEDHRGWLQFDISSIPGGSTITLVETQLLMTANGSGTAETLNINDVTGAKGNYSGNNPAAYTDLGDGLYTSFSATLAGTYGYFDLGANAITDLTTNLPSGTFQYGVDMPVQTANWKRFQASASNLRVTFNAACASPPPSGTINTTICNGGSFVFNGITYDGVNNTGVDTINVTGCDSVVFINVTELPAITGTLDSTICNGESFVFNGTTYDGVNNSGIEIFTAANGCDSIVTVTVMELAALDIAITTNSNTITANLTGANYQWIDCNNNNTPIVGETNQSFTATAIGVYAVVISVGSCSDTSACENITTVGIGENDFGSVISLSPNPTSENVNLDFGQRLNGGSIIILDVTGKQIYSLENLNKQKLSININDYSRGVYFVKIQNNNKQKVIKLVKQ